MSCLGRKGIISQDYDPGMPDDLSETMSALEQCIQDYRKAYRITGDPEPYVGVLPHWLAQECIARYGSLQAAADAYFQSGAVKLMDQYWEEWCWETQERVNRRLGHSATNTP